MWLAGVMGKHGAGESVTHGRLRLLHCINRGAAFTLPPGGGLMPPGRDGVALACQMGAGGVSRYCAGWCLIPPG